MLNLTYKFEVLTAVSGDGLLEYESDPLYVNESLTIAFDVVVKDNTLYDAFIENVVMVSAYPVGSGTPLVSKKMSNVVQAQVKNPVPESSTFFFLGIDLLGLFAVVRKRRSKK